jgi:hypothetical protein
MVCHHVLDDRSTHEQSVIAGDHHSGPAVQSLRLLGDQGRRVPAERDYLRPVDGSRRSQRPQWGRVSGWVDTEGRCRRLSRWATRQRDRDASGCGTWLGARVVIEGR